MSGFWFASLKPIIVIIEEAASERLLNASAVMDIDFVIKPTSNLAVNRSKLSVMPMIPDRIPYK